MPTAPTPHTALPAAPSTDDPANFDTEADAFVGALETFGDQMDALATNAYNNAVEANADAIATAADRVQTGLDRTAASDSASDAADFATAAAGSATTASGAASTAAGWKSTSTSSLALTAGSKSITIQTAKQYTPGDEIKVKRTSAPTTTYAHTSVTTYDAGTGELTFTLETDRISGSGTYTDWTVSLSGERGATGPEGEIPDSVNADIAAAFVYIAELTGTAAGMAAGVADAFEDENGVDGSGSTNETYDGTNDLYDNRGATYSTDQPAQTGTSTPTGYVVSASTTIGGSSVVQAFDQSASTEWYSASTTAPHWIKRQFPSSRQVTGYSLSTASSSGAFRPTAWTLEGSNDDSAWTTLDTRTAQNPTTSPTAYSIATPGVYTYLRLTITATSGSASQEVAVRELLFTFAASFPLAMSLRSVAYTAVSTPTIARFSVAADLNGGAVNTDLIAYASRDNGTTWTAVTLTAGRTLGDGTTVYEGSGSIAAQPSGTTMKWRVDTTDDYDVAVSSVVFQWS